MKLFATLYFSLLTTVVLSAQTQHELDSAFIGDNFSKREVMVPMRDGKQLFTSIYSPKDQGKRFQDVRGRYMSEGDFSRAPCHKSGLPASPSY